MTPGRRNLAPPPGHGSPKRRCRWPQAASSCCRQPGRPGQPPRRVSLDGQLWQQILDRDQPGDVGAYRLAELARGSKDALVALRAPRLEHRGQVAVERTAAQGDLDHAADPGRVKRHLLVSWIASSDGRWRMDVSIPEPAEPEDLFGRRFQTAAFSCAMTASATWLVPTAVGSSRFSFRS